jgi:phospholipid/cholesterol/gamma-HCH transport system substrate-binding protein
MREDPPSRAVAPQNSPRGSHPPLTADSPLSARWPEGRRVTAARVAAVAALAVAIVALGVLLLGGGGGTQYRLRFQNAGQLVKGDDVQVGGRRIGSVRKIELTDNNQAEITVRVQKPYAPLHEGTTAVIRATSLSGIANRYIALTPGPNSNPKLDDGATLGTDSTTSIVDLDQLFNTFDPRTRRSLQQFIQGSAEWYAGRGTQANDATKYFAPALSSSTRLVSEVIRDQGTLNAFLRNASRTSGALARRRVELAALVGNANTTAKAIADENTAFSQALSLLPGTLRKANTTFVNLRATLDDLDVLVAASKPATKDLARFLSELRPLVNEARPTIADLSTLVHQSGPNNDLTDLLRKAPALERAAKPAFAHSVTALQQVTPVLTFIRPYTPDFVGWLRDFGQGASNYDANGHFARIQPVFNAYSFADNPAGGLLVPQPASQRFSNLQIHTTKRCPGAASQAPPDKSAPFKDFNGQLDCDASLVPPGP